MLHVNDDSNDEIFRKAANDYFLDAGNPDFNKLVGNTDTTVDSSTGETGIPGKKKNYHYFFSALCWPCTKIIQNWPFSFFRIFRQHRWYEKTKKKINHGFIPLHLCCNYYRFCPETII